MHAPSRAVNWSRFAALGLATVLAAFTLNSIAVLVISLIPDFTFIPTQPGWTSAETAILVAMHVVAAGVIVRMLTSSSR